MICRIFRDVGSTRIEGDYKPANSALVTSDSRNRNENNNCTSRSCWVGPFLHAKKKPTPNKPLPMELSVGTTSTNMSLKTGTAASGTTQVTILSGGNVGIGTTSPTSKLDVNGTVKGSSLFVANGIVNLSNAGTNFTLNTNGLAWTNAQHLKRVMVVANIQYIYSYSTGTSL